MGIVLILLSVTVRADSFVSQWSFLLWKNVFEVEDAVLQALITSQTLL